MQDVAASERVRQLTRHRHVPRELPVCCGQVGCVYRKPVSSCGNTLVSDKAAHPHNSTAVEPSSKVQQKCCSRTKRLPAFIPPPSSSAARAHRTGRPLPGAIGSRRPLRNNERADSHGRGAGRRLRS